MTIRSRTLVAIVCVLVVLTSVIAVGAQARQERQAKQDAQVVTVQSGSGSGVGVGVRVEPGTFAFASGQGDNTFVFVSSEMSFDGKTVKGAPYSAQAVSESVQTLADGNRIVRRNTASVYRDSEGRTRREQSLNAVGAYSAGGDQPQLILINDPVAGVNYILDVKSHTARKFDLSAARKLEVSGEVMAAKKRMIETAKSKPQDGAGANAEQKQNADAEVKAELKARIAKAETEVRVGSVGIPGGIPGGVFEHSITTKIDPKNMKKEALGKQTIEGVEADGERFTTTIAAGEIGNEQPISIVSERWYSEELQTVVMSKHSDPRLGEHTYRLTNINRSEPAHSLFELSSDYTVKETIEPGMRLKLENELRRPREKQQQ
ncbi:MAG TPA: hypothetical protein VGL29_22580 [Blastocatellia bacterium]